MTATVFYVGSDEFYSLIVGRKKELIADGFGKRATLNIQTIS